jgi:hypothetical protein
VAPQEPAAQFLYAGAAAQDVAFWDARAVGLGSSPVTAMTAGITNAK